MDPMQTIVILYAAGAFDGPKEQREYEPPSYCEGQTVEQCNVLIEQHNTQVACWTLGFVALVIAAFVVVEWRSK